MKNPIINELLSLKLINELNLIILSNKTRDRKIKVIKDLKTKIIFLEKYLSTNTKALTPYLFCIYLYRYPLLYTI